MKRKTGGSMTIHTDLNINENSRLRSGRFSLPRQSIRAVVTSVVVGILVTVGMAGCTSQSTPADAAATSTVTGTDGNYQEGDYHLQGSGMKITDEYGEYEESYRLPLEDDSSSSGGQPVLPALVAAGFTQEDFDLAKVEARNIALDVSFDSPISDHTVSDAEYTDWLNSIITKYKFDSELTNGISSKNNSIVFTGYVDSSQGQLPRLIRDGFPRIAEDSSSFNLGVYSALPLDVNGQTLLHVTVDTKLYYRVSDQAAIDYSAAVTGKTPDEVLSSMAKASLKDGSGTNYLKVSGTYDVVFQKAGADLIVTTIQNTYKIDASDFLNE